MIGHPQGVRQQGTGKSERPTQEPSAKTRLAWCRILGASSLTLCFLTATAIGQPPGSGYPGSSSGPPAGYPGGSGGPPAGYPGSDPSGYPGGSYESDSYGGGGQYPGAAPGSADVTQAIDGGILQALGQFDFVSLARTQSGAKLPTGPILLSQAEQAMTDGHQQLAMDLLYGHMIAEFPDARPAFKTIRYSALFKRPVWQVRWGVSVMVRLDEVAEAKPLQADTKPGGFAGAGYESGYDPSYESQYDSGYDTAAMDPRQGQMRGVNGAPAAPAVPQVDVNEILEKNLGLIAVTVSEGFAKRFQTGAFGAGLTSLKPPVVETPAANAVAGGNPAGYPDAGSGYEDTSSGYEDGSGYDSGMDPANGYPGAGYPGADGYAGPGGRQPGAAVEPPPIIGPAPITPPADALPMWTPGILFVGEGPSADMLTKSREAGVELLMHFDVSAKPAGRNGEVQNVTYCRIYQVSTGKSLIASQGIDTIEAMQSTRTGRTTNADYVNKQMTSVWSYIDRAATVVPLPAITADIAKRRVGMIVTSPPAERLQTLAEIRMYEAAGLLQPADVALAFDLVAGDEAMKLLYGPVNDRRDIIREWASE